MVPLQMILGEVLTVLNYGIWFLGLVTFVGLITVLCYAFFFDWSLLIGETKGESSIYQLDDVQQQLSTERLGTPAFQSTGGLLDICRVHRKELRKLYVQLCERAGVDPTSSCDMASLIAEAVYDGRQQYSCINAVDAATQERSTEQHA